MNSTIPNWMMRRGVEAVGERARPDREQQERQPVRDHRIAAERRRVEFLVDHPVADDVLDGVRHHRQHGAAEIGAIAGLAQRGEGAVRGLRHATALGRDILHLPAASQRPDRPLHDRGRRLVGIGDDRRSCCSPVIGTTLSRCFLASSRKAGSRSIAWNAVAQRRDAVGRHLGRRHERPAHGGAREEQFQRLRGPPASAPPATPAARP